MAACPHIDGVRIEDLIKFLETHSFKDYLPDAIRNGKPIKYSRSWLLTVISQQLIFDPLIIGLCLTRKRVVC